MKRKPCHSERNPACAEKRVASQGCAEWLPPAAWAWSRAPRRCRRKGKSALRQGLHFRRQSNSWLSREYISLLASKLRLCIAITPEKGLWEVWGGAPSTFRPLPGSENPLESLTASRTESEGAVHTNWVQKTHVFETIERSSKPFRSTPEPLLAR